MNAFRRSSVLFLLLAASAAFVSTARAVSGERHLHLLKSTPADGSTLDVPPAAIDLWFSEAPEVKVTTVQLAGATGKVIKLEDVTADAEDDTHVIAAVDSAVTAGAWKVTWRTMSDDGHVVNGAIEFTVRSAH